MVISQNDPEFPYSAHKAEYIHKISLKNNVSFKPGRGERTCSSLIKIKCTQMKQVMLFSKQWKVYLHKNRQLRLYPVELFPCLICLFIYLFILKNLSVKKQKSPHYFCFTDV